MKGSKMTGMEWGLNFLTECVTLFVKMVIGGCVTIGILAGLAWLAVCPDRYGWRNKTQ
jgi:hypothetical protein